jgi:TolB-like protein/DNA-binding winged helix-turn-helix (wHTH) protein
MPQRRAIIGANFQVSRSPRLKGDFRIGKWLVQPQMNTLQANGKTKHVEPKAMQVLVYLAEHADEVVTKERLMRAVWADTFVTDDVLTRCVFELRKAFEDDAKNPQIIETIPRSGYRLVAAVQSADVKPAGASVATRRWPIALATVAGLALLGLSLKVGGLRRRIFQPTPAVAIHSLAVLPLANLSGDPEQEYFADGMTEELITNLAKIESLRVVSRTSVMEFKGAHKALPEIARALNVDLIVEGTVVRSGDQVRITAQLIDGRSDMHRWGQDFASDQRNVLNMQSDVAQAIAREIKVELTKDDGIRLAPRPAINPAAQEAYLRGRYQWSKRHVKAAQALKESIRLYQQAIEADPSYALAYAGIADSYIVLENDGLTTPGEAYPAIRAAATKAVEADPNLADAHLMLANVRETEWDWTGAEREYKRAIELNPGLSRAHQWYATLLVNGGRPGEAISEIERAVQSDPLADSVYWEKAYICYLARQYEKVAGVLQTVEYRTPGSSDAHYQLGLVDLAKKKYPEAISEFLTLTSTEPDQPDNWALLTFAYAQGDRRKEAMEAVANLDRLEKQRFVAPYWKAVAWIGLDRDRAFDFLEEAYRVRSSQLLLIQSEPLFDLLRSDPRFQDLLHRLALPIAPADRSISK